MSNNDKIQTAFETINKSFGKGTLVQMTPGGPPYQDVKVISSGLLSVDRALGTGGWAKGRIFELFGPECSGKTTLALCAAASAQAQGGIAAIVDVEHALDPRHAGRLGVRVEDLLVSQPGSAEEALEILEALIKLRTVDLIILDSVGGLIPRAEIEGAVGDAAMGMQARLMSQSMRKITALATRSGTVVLFVNKVQEKFGVVFGPSDSGAGGRALKFFASGRVEVRRGEMIRDGETPIGFRTKVKVCKNKLAPPFQTAEFDLLFNEGPSRESDVLELALEFGLVEKNGAWYSFEEVRLAQGKENTRLYLKQNPEYFARIRRLVVEQLVRARDDGVAA